EPQGARDYDSGRARPPQQTNCGGYRHCRSHREGASQPSDAQDEGPFASRAKSNGGQAQAGTRGAATLLKPTHRFSYVSHARQLAVLGRWSVGSVITSLSSSRSAPPSLRQAKMQRAFWLRLVNQGSASE